MKIDHNLPPFRHWAETMLFAAIMIAMLVFAATLPVVGCITLTVIVVAIVGLALS